MAIPLALALFSLVIALLSLYGVFQPSRLISFVRGLMANTSGLLIAVAARVILAALLWFSAPLSLTPITFRVLAILALASAFALPLLWPQRIQKIMASIGNWPTPAIRLLILFGVVFGGFIFWSISPVFTAV